MKILDIVKDLTKYDHSSGKQWIEHTYNVNFNTMEEDLEELLEELNEVCGIVFNLSIVLENMGFIDSCVYEMGTLNEILNDLTPLELLQKIDFDKFNPHDDYFSWNIWGIYSGNYVDDFDDMSELSDILDQLQEDTVTMLNYIRGDYYDGFDDLEKHKRDILNEFIAYLTENNDHIEDVEDLRRSAII